MSFASASAAPERLPDHAPESVPESVIAGMLAVLRLMAERFTDAFGAPAALAKGGAVYGKTRERILRWLHDMECVVRRLLLLRAAIFPAPAPRAASPVVRRSKLRRKEGAAEDLFGPSEDPALWRVAFRMPAPAEAAWMRGDYFADGADDLQDEGDESTRSNGGATLQSTGFYWVDDPRPLAERFEALLRVLNDHDHYAARLAQRLYGWRGRVVRREVFLQGLCAISPIANEARLPDADWRAFAEARSMTQALLPVFSQALCAPEAAPPRAPPENAPPDDAP